MLLQKSGVLICLGQLTTLVVAIQSIFVHLLYISWNQINSRYNYCRQRIDMQTAFIKAEVYVYAEIYVNVSTVHVNQVAACFHGIPT